MCPHRSGLLVLEGLRMSEDKKERDFKIWVFIVCAVAISLIHNTVGWGQTGTEAILSYVAVALTSVAIIGFLRSVYR